MHTCTDFEIYWCGTFPGPVEIRRVRRFNLFDAPLYPSRSHGYCLEFTTRWLVVTPSRDVAGFSARCRDLQGRQHWGSNRQSCSGGIHHPPLSSRCGLYYMAFGIFSPTELVLFEVVFGSCNIGWSVGVGDKPSVPPNTSRGTAKLWTTFLHLLHNQLQVTR